MQFQQGLYGVYLDEDPALPDAPYIYLYVADADFFFSADSNYQSQLWETSQAHSLNADSLLWIWSLLKY